jgi:hypothetical protein
VNLFGPLHSYGVTPELPKESPCNALAARRPAHDEPRENIEIDYCPQCRGVWLDRGEPAGIAPCMVQPDPRPLRGGKGTPVSMSVIDVSGGFKRSAQHLVERDHRRSEF